MNNRPQLVLSALINLLLIGSILGCIFWPQPPRWQSLLNEYGNNLPAERRDMINAAFDKIHTDAQGAYQQICLARDDADQLLRANPYHKADYAAATQRVRQLRDDLGEKMNTEIMDLADRLTPQERQVLAGVTHSMSVKDYVGNKVAACEAKTPTLK